MKAVLGPDQEENERLFEQARHLPLLDAGEERAVDAAKWAAGRALRDELVGDPAARQYLARWLQNARECPPRVAEITPRSHYYLLRREMAEILTVGRQPATGDDAPLASPERPPTLASLSLLPSLAAGLAAVVLRHDGGLVSCNIADAINVWERCWPATAWPAGRCLSAVSRRLLREQRTDYLRARDTLVMHNLRLVYSIAGKYRGQGVSFPDLVQEATFGLIRAAEKYDAARGYRFSTYSFNWITQSVRRAVANDGGMIRYPSHVQEKVNKLYRLRSESLARSGEEPGDGELAMLAGLSLAETRGLLGLRNQASSMDAPRPGEDSGGLHELLAAESSGEAARSAESESLQRHLLEQLQRTLDPVERDVITARWGLRMGRPLTRAEMAAQLCLSTERVRQLEKSALEKLQQNPDLRATFEVYRSVAGDHYLTN